MARKEQQEENTKRIILRRNVFVEGEMKSAGSELELPIHDADLLIGSRKAYEATAENKKKAKDEIKEKEGE